MSDDVHDLAAAYVLDALDDDERELFEEHLAACPDCTVDVEDLRVAAADLGESLPPVAPPPGLRAQLMAEIASTPQASVPGTSAPESSPPESSAAGNSPIPITPTDEPARVTPAAPRNTRWITLVAAAVVVVLLGFGAVIAFGGGDDPAPDPTELAIAEMREVPDVVTVDLEGDAGGTVQVMYSAEEQRAMLVGEDLDDPSADHVYQLWTISGDQPTPSVVFTPTNGELAAEMEMDFDPPEAWAITVEPTGGSPAPTGDIVFQGTPA